MNNQTAVTSSTLLRNKLSRLAVRLQSNANRLGQNSDFPSLESIVTESVKILSKFYKDLSEPGFVPVELLPDTAPDSATFNNNNIMVQDDLETIFNEFENLEGVVLGSFNYMTSRLNRLNRKLKSVSSKLGDFILFSNLATKDAIFFSDSFNNLSRVEVNTPLLNAEQSEINQVEGIATLPIDRNSQVSINVRETPVINSNSNGVSGNNQELGATLHGTLSDILDNNADTWFEYERVVTADDGVSLTLDFTINIGEEKVINFVRINPNNFGTRTQVEILSIDTSTDGEEFVSIKDDIPIADFLVEDEDNVFTLAPSTSKFAGQGLYTFTPRKAKYMHITLRQSTPYLITTTTNTEAFRYAIGIRDIDIQALPYKIDGELISIEYEILDDVRKVVLESNQNPDAATTSSLVSIKHFVSPDNGLTWHQIRPKVSAGNANVDQNIPELLDFNGVAEDSIATNSPVKTLRYKAVFNRASAAFVDGATDLAQVIASNTELHQPPNTTPFEIQLQNKPIQGTVKLIDPQFGGRGRDDVTYQIAKGTNNKRIIHLPFKPFLRDFEKTGTGLVGDPFYLIDKDPQKFYIDGVLWTRGALTGTLTNYKLNFEDGVIEFGDGTDGAVVPLNASISMSLTEESIFPSRGVDHIASLAYPTSNDKKQVEVSILHPPKTDTFVLKKGVKRHELKPDIVYDIATDKAHTTGEFQIKLNGGPAFVSEEIFIDGDTELTGTGEYSFDFTNGMLYSYDRTDSSADSTILYKYNPRTVLTEDQWKFVDADDGIANAISISDNVYQTFLSKVENVPASVNYFNLGNIGIVKGTISVTGTTTSFATEVEFIDGRSELLGAIHASEELDPITTGAGVATIPFTMQISQDTGFSVDFTNSEIFVTEVFVTPTVDGEYQILRGSGTTGEIKVQVADDVAEPGSVTYYYIDPQADLSGRFSVNYQTGEVYTYDNTPSVYGAAMVQYEYTDVKIKYNIARLINPDDWEIQVEDSKITIKDREILKNIRTPQSVSSTASKFYQVSYDYVKSTRANVSELEPFFTPTLKDYALKVITKSRLI